MRLVISVAEEDVRKLPLHGVAEAMSVWMNGMLKSHYGPRSRLKTKAEKSEAIAWEDFAVQGSASQFMRVLQGQISVAPDPVALMQVTGSLDHLLWLADAIADESTVENNILALAKISLPKVDVRDDTIRRFSANRLRQVMRLRRSMADPDLPAANSVSIAKVSELRALDHEMETVARKLVACWSRNPSLASVLRCGLDIYPSVEILRPVLQALLSKLPVAGKADNEGLVAIYILADVFRAASVETGLHRKESYPEGADIEAYRSELVQVGYQLFSRTGMPWYLHQQIALFFAVLKTPLRIRKDRASLESYRELHSALRYQRPMVESAGDLTAGLLVLRITGDRSKFIVWLGQWLNKLNAAESKTVIERVAMVEPDLVADLVRDCGHYGGEHWLGIAENYVAPRGPSDHRESISQWRAGERSLVEIASHPENPFVQENALLKLARALLEINECKWDDDELCIHRIRVGCENWQSIQDPNTSIWATVCSGGSYSPPWSDTPSWVRSDMAWAYRLGRILRSAVIGGSDYTSRHYQIREETFDRYRGLGSTWYKRRLGLVPLTSGLGAEPTPVSPWLNELVMRLLQWPGLELQSPGVNGLESVRSREELREIVVARMKVQSSYYGSLSKLPAYVLPVDSNPTMDLKRFRVALVQTLLPNDTDLCATDPLLWTSDFRARHRAHLASMCRLITQQLAAARFARKEEESGLLDLIVFPELSVHPDDLWLLRRLSDATEAAIFAGQTFVKHTYHDAPINRAVWLVRQRTSSGRSIAAVYQGKQNGIPWEKEHGVVGHRPYQVIVSFTDRNGVTANLTGAVCFDATDLKLCADMRDVTDAFIVCALNRDVSTFDTMAGALHFHMYQPVILANTGQYGGSTAQAPFKERHDRYIDHVHGTKLATVCILEVDLTTFKSPKQPGRSRQKKSAPAGFSGRPPML